MLKKKQSVDTDSGMTQGLELADEDFEIVILTMFKGIKYAYKEVTDMKSQRNETVKEN